MTTGHPVNGNKNNGPKARIELELDKRIVELLQAMEDFKKIPKSDIVTTAVKRFIATHKDFFPEGYNSQP